MRKLSHKNSNNKTSTNNYKFVEVLLLLVFLSECKRFDPPHLFLRIIDKQFIYLKFIMWFEKKYLRSILQKKLTAKKKLYLKISYLK